MSNSQVFGPLVDATVLERAILRTLEKWFHTALGRVEQATPGVAYGDVQRPRLWQPDVELRAIPEDDFPVVKVAVGAGEPFNDGEYLSLTWPFAVAVICKAGQARDARDMAHWSSFAALASLMWEPSLGNVINGLTPAGFQPPQEVRGNNNVRYAMCPVDFTAQVEQVLHLYSGPTVPDPLPDPPAGGEPQYPDRPTAEVVQVTTSHIDEE